MSENYSVQVTPVLNPSQAMKQIQDQLNKITNLNVKVNVDASSATQGVTAVRKEVSLLEKTFQNYLNLLPKTVQNTALELSKANQGIEHMPLPACA